MTTFKELKDTWPITNWKCSKCALPALYHSCGKYYCDHHWCILMEIPINAKRSKTFKEDNKVNKRKD